MLTEQDKLKKIAGEKAVEYIKDGMKVGLGSGSTVYWMIKRLGERIKQERIVVEGIPSSNKTAEWAKEFGVSLTDFSRVTELDITIDGADEVDGNLQLIKGGGGALFREKVIAQAAKQLLIIVDPSKLVKTLGAFPLPVEVLPFGWEIISKELKELGADCSLRKQNEDIYITDNGNYILDCQFSEIKDPVKLHNELIHKVGVLETGLFIDMTKTVLVGGEELRVIEK
ncbi:ribose 5-phosphate isomerase A [Oceanobacillus piezotolerans]|uniref:Ribose-5-phosphate isomerase A n=1 Tax=Oceanobacillus piezotolerans TaxID=2448030 RepID=A0A498D8N2_9BACI|nr:ribose 5-phosphate isomerase A [Oceanobacillus piezotolerans]RLL46753.1 ribose 5-phosphate isomerase A [Oceanobacillus piezotolerans]